MAEMTVREMIKLVVSAGKELVLRDIGAVEDGEICIASPGDADRREAGDVWIQDAPDLIDVVPLDKATSWFESQIRKHGRKVKND